MEYNFSFSFCLELHNSQYLLLLMNILQNIILAHSKMYSQAGIPKTRGYEFWIYRKSNKFLIILTEPLLPILWTQVSMKFIVERPLRRN